jgi:DNA repair protein RadC
MVTKTALSTSTSVGIVPGFVPLSIEDQWLCQLIRPLFTAQREMVVIVGFDRTGRLTQLIEISNDKVDSCPIEPDHWRRLFHGAPAARAMLIHNHPSGLPHPSPADIRLTRDAAIHLQFFAIDLVDHLILVANGHFSFARAGLL